MKNPKGTLTRIGNRLGWRMGMRWYGLTQRASESHGHPVQTAESVQQIAERLRFGAAYKPDPWNGKLDVMLHPRRIQRWIDEGKPIGDCDEHAAYWCAALLKSKLATSVWFVTVQFQSLEDGKISGHALCRYLTPDEPGFHVVDYGQPYVDTNPWGFVTYVCTYYNAKPLFASTTLVPRLRDDDGLVLDPEEGRGYR